MLGLLDLYTYGQSDVMSMKRRVMFGDLRLSRFIQSREVEMWVMHGFDFCPFLSLLEQEFSSAGVVCLLSAVDKFVF